MATWLSEMTLAPSQRLTDACLAHWDRAGEREVRVSEGVHMHRHEWRALDFVTLKQVW
ncbi:MAG: hypothetical protein OXK73_09905 [Rhodospirillaceae bacterium]|nr:hypothetical protein [Rhodospirillaceae bacterium]